MFEWCVQREEWQYWDIPRNDSTYPKPEIVNGSRPDRSLDHRLYIVIMTFSCLRCCFTFHSIVQRMKPSIPGQRDRNIPYETMKEKFEVCNGAYICITWVSYEVSSLLSVQPMMQRCLWFASYMYYPWCRERGLCMMVIFESYLTIDLVRR